MKTIKLNLLAIISIHLLSSIHFSAQPHHQNNDRFTIGIIAGILITTLMSSSNYPNNCNEYCQTTNLQICNEVIKHQEHSWIVNGDSSKRVLLIDDNHHILSAINTPYRPYCKCNITFATDCTK